MENNGIRLAAAGVLIAAVLIILFTRRSAHVPGASSSGSAAGTRAVSGTSPDPNVGPDPSAAPDPSARPDSDARPR